MLATEPTRALTPEEEELLAQQAAAPVPTPVGGLLGAAGAPAPAIPPPPAEQVVVPGAPAGYVAPVPASSLGAVQTTNPATSTPPAYAPAPEAQPAYSTGAREFAPPAPRAGLGAVQTGVPPPPPARAQGSPNTASESARYGGEAALMPLGNSREISFNNPSIGDTADYYRDIPAPTSNLGAVQTTLATGRNRDSRGPTGQRGQFPGRDPVTPENENGGVRGSAGIKAGGTPFILPRREAVPIDRAEQARIARDAQNYQNQQGSDIRRLPAGQASQYIDPNAERGVVDAVVQGTEGLRSGALNLIGGGDRVDKSAPPPPVDPHGERNILEAMLQGSQGLRDSALTVTGGSTMDKSAPPPTGQPVNPHGERSLLDLARDAFSATEGPRNIAAGLTGNKNAGPTPGLDDVYDALSSSTPRADTEGMLDRVRSAWDYTAPPAPPQGGSQIDAMRRAAAARDAAGRGGTQVLPTNPPAPSTWEEFIANSQDNTLGFPGTDISIDYTEPLHAAQDAATGIVSGVPGGVVAQPPAAVPPPRQTAGNSMGGPGERFDTTNAPLAAMPSAELDRAINNNPDLVVLRADGVVYLKDTDIPVGLPNPGTGMVDIFGSDVSLADFEAERTRRQGGAAAPAAVPAPAAAAPAAVPAPAAPVTPVAPAAVGAGSAPIAPARQTGTPPSAPRSAGRGGIDDFGDDFGRDEEFTEDDFLAEAGGNRARARQMATQANKRKRSRRGRSTTPTTRGGANVPTGDAIRASVAEMLAAAGVRR